jgi:hypothetical protein
MMMKCVLKRIQASDASDDAGAGAFAEMEQAMKGLMDVLFKEKVVPMLPGVFMSNLPCLGDARTMLLISSVHGVLLLCLSSPFLVAFNQCFVLLFSFVCSANEALHTLLQIISSVSGSSQKRCTSKTLFVKESNFWFLNSFPQINCPALCLKIIQRHSGGGSRRDGIGS